MTHPTNTPAAVTAAAEHAAASWRKFTDEKGYNAPITTWETTTTPDGSTSWPAGVRRGRCAGSRPTFTCGCRTAAMCAPSRI